MTDEDPPRLVDPGGPGPARLRALVEASRQDLGTAAEIAALGATLAPYLGAGAAGAKGAALGGKLTAGMLAKGAAVVVLGAAAAVYVGTRTPGNAPPAPAAPPPAARVPAEPAPPAAPPPVPEVSPVPTAPEVEATPAAPLPHRRLRAPDPAVRASEAEMLGEAQAALATDPGRALALTDAHRRQFPHAVLGQEREVIAIEALARLGRKAEAKARAERFLAAHPSSAHRSKIESIIGHP